MTKKDYELIAKIIKSETKLGEIVDEFGHITYEKRICPHDFMVILGIALKKKILNLTNLNFTKLVGIKILIVGRENMIRFTINCPDDLSAKVVRKVLEESFYPDFYKELNISEKTIKEE